MDFTEENSLKRIDKNISLLISNFNNKNSELEIQQINKDAIIICYSSNSNLDTLINLNPNLIYLNLKECINNLKKENNLDEKSDLLIIGNKYLNISSINNLDYEIYSREGNKIADISACNETVIELSTPIDNYENINYYEAEYLSKQNHDIYNKSSSFYYDYCLSAYINQSDLTINVRQQEIYPKNITLCPEGCNYNSIDYKNKRINCICNSNITEEEIEFIVEQNTNFFKFIIEILNYRIIICYEKLYDINSYVYNFGFYIGALLFCSFIILYIIYRCFGKKSIKMQYFNKEPNMKEIKELERQFEKKHKDIPLKTNVELVQLDKIVQFHTFSKANPEKKSKRKVKKLKFSKTKGNEKISSGNLNLNYASDISNNTKDIALPKRLPYLKKSIQRKSLLYIPKENKIDYCELTFDEAMDKDGRSIFQMFIYNFIIKFQTIQLFLKPKEFTHFSLTLSLYLFDILLDITFNSFLFTDDVISEKYFNNGKLLFFTTNTLSITANIISFFFIYLMEKLINQHKALDLITKEIKNRNNFLAIFIKLNSCFEIKILFFFIILFIIGLFCTYYLFIFFAIYKKLQKNVFVNYIIGSLWSLGLTIFVCLFVSITRKISINKKMRLLYLISLFVDEKF